MPLIIGFKCIYINIINTLLEKSNIEYRLPIEI